MPVLDVGDLHSRTPWTSDAHAQLNLLDATGVLELVLTLERPVVPDTVEVLLLRLHDLVKLPRLLLEVGLVEQFLYLFAEVAKKDRVRPSTPRP